MKKFAAALVFSLSLITIGLAQQPRPIPTPPPLVDNTDVVKISTNLIQIDAIVTDTDGNIVRDLKPEDFEIYENGIKQDITSFSFVSSGSEQVIEKKVGNSGKIIIPTPQKEIKPGQVRRTMALVVDDLSLSFESMHFVRRSLRNFVENQMQDGDLVAIIRTGAGIGALQQFTSDKRLLFAAVDKIIWNPRGKGGVSTFAPLSVGGGGFQGSSPTSIDDVKEADGINGYRQSEGYRNEIFTAGTLGALNYVVGGMSELPGRKSIMLLSDGFSLYSQAGNASFSSVLIKQRLRKLVDAANRASVVINTIDARGLQTLGFTAADDTGSRNLDDGRIITPDKSARANQDRNREIFNSQDGLAVLADETGGFAIFNDNDLKGGIRRMLNEQSYYLIGYQPDSDTFNAEKDRFNKFEIKVKGEGLKVRYRSGFFGITDKEFDKPKQNLTAEQSILEAIYSPFAVNGISLRLNTLFSNTAKQGSLVRSLLHVDTKDLTFTDKGNGKKRLTFDILAANFDTKGIALDEISKTYDITLSGKKYENFVKDGFVYFFEFPVKKEGAYQMRVVLRDHASGKVGSASQFIEIPKLKKDRPVLSDLILENLTAEQWNREAQNNQINVIANQNEQSVSEPLRDTSLRVFKRRTVLRYAFEIYNPKFETGQKPQLNMRTRLFYDGKIVYEGKPQPIDVSGQTDLSRVQTLGALNLSGEMKFGEYILQIVVTDELTKDKYRTATQFVQFELVK